jgi:hypothetical protein
MSSALGYRLVVPGNIRAGLVDEPERGVDFWLGDRGEGKVTDFDGRLRACRVLKRVGIEGAEAKQLLVHVDPPLPLGSGRSVNHVVLGPRWRGRDLQDLPQDVDEDGLGYLSVYIYEVLDERAVASGVLRPGDLRADWYGEIARRPEQLPSTQEENFERSFRVLEGFVARQGNADVPLHHREDGVGLGVWVSNMRFTEANTGLREGWARRLAALPGWKWLPGDDFFLVERYARREGHTRIPEDYVEEGRPLGRWASQQRRVHAAGRLARDYIERLERIPGWEW